MGPLAVALLFHPKDHWFLPFSSLLGWSFGDITDAVLKDLESDADNETDDEVVEDVDVHDQEFTSSTSV